MSLLSPDNAILSVTELNQLAHKILESQFSGVWVAGEISNLTHAASGHWYFSLKDERAQVRCVLFKGSAAKLDKPLQMGDHVEVAGRIGLFEARGEFQITVASVRHAGLGALYEAFAALREKLLAEGLFDESRKRPLPVFPQRVGIVTSLSAAALRDVLSTLKRRMNAAKVIVYPTAVQGKGSEIQIAQAIDTANERNEVDVLLVCRGGGSLEDLWAFNEEAVVRAVARSSLPIISGVGHETDFTLTDFAADMRAPTPTAAAELAVPEQAQLRELVNAHGQQQSLMWRRRLEDGTQRLDWLASRLLHPAQRLARDAQRIQVLHLGMSSALNANVVRLRQRFDAARRFHAPETQILRQHVLSQSQALQSGWQNLLIKRQARLEKFSAVLTALSPEAILARGFSIVTDQKGRVVTQAGALKLGQRLNIQFHEGAASVQVAQQNSQQDLFESH